MYSALDLVKLYWKDSVGLKLFFGFFKYTNNKNYVFYGLWVFQSLETFSYKCLQNFIISNVKNFNSIFHVNDWITSRSADKICKMLFYKSKRSIFRFWYFHRKKPIEKCINKSVARFIFAFFCSGKCKCEKIFYCALWRTDVVLEWWCSDRRRSPKICQRKTGLKTTNF